MFRPESITGFALRAIVLYAILAGFWLVAKSGYPNGFRATGSVLFTSFGNGGRARFIPNDASGGNKGTRIVCTNRNAPGFEDRALCVSSHHLAYVPTVTLIALALATPISWRRRGWAVLWGLACVHCFVAFRLAIMLLNKLSFDNAIRAFELSPPAKSFVLFVCDSIFGSIFICDFVVPMLIWFGLTFGMAASGRQMEPGNWMRGFTGCLDRR